MRLRSIGFLKSCEAFAHLAQQRTAIAIGTLMLALNFRSRPVFLGEASHEYTLYYAMYTYIYI